MLEQTSSPDLLVACLCAQWCNTCCDYQSTFWQMQQKFSEARFVWVDIEDQSDMVDPVEVENFPTLLISAKDTPCFFGTVTPHADTLRRLVQSYINTEPAPWRGATEINNLVARLLAQEHHT